MKIVAVIPIKLNNERLPGKNTLLLGGKPLIYYIQKNLIAEERVNQRFVFCSNDTIQEYLLPGITYLKRPQYLDAPTSNFTQIFGEFAERVNADIYIYAHATAPFIENATTKECLDNVLSGKFDSAFCATEIRDFLWCDKQPLNFDADNLPRSQDLKPIYRETSGIYVFTKEVFSKYHRRIGVNPFIKIVNYREAIDINTEEDFKLASLWLG